MGNRGLIWGLALGVLAALVILLTPVTTLEGIVSGSGLPAILPAATPPLGSTAHAMLAALAFALTTMVGALIGHRSDDAVEDADDFAPAPLRVSEQMTTEPAVTTGVASVPAAPVAMPREAAAPRPVTALREVTAPRESLAPRDAADLDARLTRIEAALAELPALTTKAIKTSPSADLDKTLRSIQRSLRKRLPDPALLNAARSIQDGPSPDAVLARVEALEARITDQLAEISDRLASLGSAPAEPAGAPVIRLPRHRPNGLANRRIGETVADIRRSIESLGS